MTGLSWEYQGLEPCFATFTEISILHHLAVLPLDEYSFAPNVRDDLTSLLFQLCRQNGVFY